MTYEAELERERARYREIFATVDPVLAEEVRERMKVGHVAFLPSQVRMERGRIFLGEAFGWSPMPAYDPAVLPPGGIELLFLLDTGNGFMIELRRRRAG